MSTSTGAFGLAAHNRKKSSRKVIPQHFLGGVAVAAVVLGCAWTVYTNVFGASIYPSVNSAAFDAPVVRNSTIVAAALRRGRPSTRCSPTLPQPAAKISAPETVSPSIMFNERFAASAPQGDTLWPSERQIPATQVGGSRAPVEAPKKIDAPKLAEAPKTRKPQPAPVQVALNVPAPAPKPVEPRTSAAKARGLRPRHGAARQGRRDVDCVERQADHGREIVGQAARARSSLLSYASADASVTGSIIDTRAQNPMLGGSPPYDKQTAVYDISAKTVYLPDGTKLEAHSGLGSKMDDVRYAHVRMQGVTPPHIYELKPREALFHGVPALRLTPIGGEDKIFGRDGLLAHTYMLGGRGDSNGCVSFKDYYAFLNAYRNQGIRRLAVLARVE